MHNIASRWHTRILLSGGSEADLTITLPVGQKQALDTEFDGEAWTLSLIWTGINLLIQTMPPAAGVKTANKLIVRLGKARCFAELVDAAQTASLSLTTAQKLGSTAFDCLAAVAKGFGGQILTVSSIFASLITGVIAAVWGSVDVVFGDASHALAVERLSAPCTSAALTATLDAHLNQPGGWKVLGYACQGGYSFAMINPVTGGMQAVAILQQQESSWRILYSGEGLCLPPGQNQSMCQGYKQPMPIALLKSLMRRAGYLH